MMEFIESQPDDQPTEVLPRYFTNRFRFVIHYVVNLFPVKMNFSMSEILLTESQTDNSSDQSSFMPNVIAKKSIKVLHCIYNSFCNTFLNKF